MKLCLTILSVPWYMFNGLEHTAILSYLLTFITGSSSRLLRIRFSADLTMYWLPVCHFRCKEFNPLVIWIWNQNIAISTIVGTSSHINQWPITPAFLNEMNIKCNYTCTCKLLVIILRHVYGRFVSEMILAVNCN